MKQFIRKASRIMLASLIILIVLFGGVMIFVNSAPQFGSKVSGERLETIRQSPNYQDGEFQNLIETKMDFKAKDIPGLMYDFTFKRKSREPKKNLPVAFGKHANSDVDSLIYITWYGHSAILLEIEGYRILIDPMLGPAASPLPFMTRRFPYQEPIDISKIQDIDAIILSHDHYDHLDYQSITQLKDRVGHFFTPLAVGEHLKRWGVPQDAITELDWWQSSNLGHINLVSTPARHFSGRAFSDRNKTLWSSWVIAGRDHRVYFSGDGGYGPHFKDIGEKYGPFDFTMIECGQYNELWEAIHMMPEQSVRAHIDVGGKVMMPIHWGAFNLALHDWTDPIERASKEANSRNVNLVNPVIGQRFAPEVEFAGENWWDLGE